MQSDGKSFSEERCQKLADDIADLLNSSDGLAIEKVYAICANLRWLGESLYDKPNLSIAGVLEDYNEAPTFPAALIIISTLPHQIREMLIEEKKNPGSYVDPWLRGKNGDN